MTPADIERAVAALRRAFPAVADEGVERFRRELEPRWTISATRAALHDRSRAILAECESLQDSDRWVWGLVAATTGDYASTRSDAMRAAERALGLPECEVVT